MSENGGRCLVVGLALVGLFAISGFAAHAETLTLDPSATEITFELDATGHKVEGVLHLTSGTIEFDPETGTAAGEIVLDARKTETGNKRRDKKMHEKVLDSVEFPSIVFRPERIEGAIDLAGSSEFDLIGTVTLLGVDHAMTIASRATIEGQRVEAVGSLTVPYVAWGLHDPSVLILRVAKVVDVRLETSGVLTP